MIAMMCTLYRITLLMKDTGNGIDLDDIAHLIPHLKEWLRDGNVRATCK
jgi:hypothetical protein